MFCFSARLSRAVEREELKSPYRKPDGPGNTLSLGSPCPRGMLNSAECVLDVMKQTDYNKACHASARTQTDAQTRRELLPRTGDLFDFQTAAALPGSRLFTEQPVMAAKRGR